MRWCGAVGEGPQVVWCSRNVIASSTLEARVLRAEPADLNGVGGSRCDRDVVLPPKCSTTGPVLSSSTIDSLARRSNNDDMNLIGYGNGHRPKVVQRCDVQVRRCDHVRRYEQMLRSLLYFLLSAPTTGKIKATFEHLEINPTAQQRTL